MMYFWIIYEVAYLQNYRKMQMFELTSITREPENKSLLEHHH